jgi:transcriptional regulator with XRE-family HTH domain
MNVHIGSKIRKVRTERGLSTTQLGKKMNLSRLAVNYMEKQGMLHTKRIFELCEVLEHDFWQYFVHATPTTPYTAIDPEAHKALQQENEALKKELDYLREINQLLRGKK